MSKDLLFDKFKYNVNDEEQQRKQCLLNAYILYGFEGLVAKLQTVPTNDSPIAAENVKSDISFVQKEKERLKQ